MLASGNAPSQIIVLSTQNWQICPNNSHFTTKHQCCVSLFNPQIWLLETQEYQIDCGPGMMNIEGQELKNDIYTKKFQIQIQKGQKNNKLSIKDAVTSDSETVEYNSCLWFTSTRLLKMGRLEINHPLWRQKK